MYSRISSKGAYALKHYFDEIETIDILDCNGGDHGYPFATNFNPEINLREVSANGSYWENGHWVETKPMEIKRVYDFPQVGEKDMYLLHHEEIESLAKNIPGVKRIRFFMTFGQSYLTHMKCLENVGMLSTSEIEVSPPGKVIKNLSALSGGEQALVAISIYFAILNVNPAPFCFLDEIEAALDDVNVARYAQYLRRMTDHTQFIVITHRRGTMEAADVLYGVTMQEDGVSKILRLDLDNVSADLIT